jgi:hypothetical protein
MATAWLRQLPAAPTARLTATGPGDVEAGCRTVQEVADVIVAQTGWPGRAV